MGEAIIKTPSIVCDIEYFKEASSHANPPEFGKEIREQEFDLLPDHVYLNQGSYGVVPSRVKAAQLDFTHMMEQAPDTWFRWTYEDRQREHIESVASFLGFHAKDAVFVENASTGISNIMKCIKWNPGDGILINNWTYWAMVNTTRYIRHFLQPDVEVISIQNKYPVSDKQEVIDLYRETLDQHPNIKFVLIDHIASGTAVVFPVKELAALCHEYGKLVLIDGAHVPGHILNLNIEDIGADFYVGTLYKWMWSGRGCAIQWMSPEHQNDSQRPVVTSLAYNEDWPIPYGVQGCRDGTGYTSATEAVAFFDFMGGMEAAWTYNKELADQAEVLLADAWGTEMLDVPEDMKSPFMRLVKLPDMHAFPPTEEGRRKLLLTLLEEFKIVSLITSPSGVPGEWIRISINVYCTLEDVESLRDAILDMATWPPDDTRIRNRATNYDNKEIM